jgi:hypothetical protein
MTLDPEQFYAVSAVVTSKGSGRVSWTAVSCKCQAPSCPRNPEKMPRMSASAVIFLFLEYGLENDVLEAIERGWATFDLHTENCALPRGQEEFGEIHRIER